MTSKSYYRVNMPGNNPILSLLTMVVVVIGLFFIARGLYRILTVIAPVLLIVAAVMNYKVITGYIRWLWDRLKANWLSGLLLIFLSIVGFPLVAGYLCFKAVVTRRMSRMQREAHGDFISYEEVSSEQLDISRPPVVQREEQSDYQDLFE